MTATPLTELQRAARREARDALWRSGSLDWMLDFGRPTGPQRDFYEKSKNSPRKTFVNESARRIGKSVALVVIAFELALKNPGARINWCQDTSKGVRSSAIKTMEKICRNAPADCKGRFDTLRSSFVFPNGAYIFIFGGNTQEDADGARGGDDPIASFFDEGGFMRFLQYIYRSIIKPGMRRVVRSGHYGMIFVSSSTPEETDHFFIQLANLMEIHGSYLKRTIYDSDDPTRYIAEEAADAGLTVEQYTATDAFRRELLCERVVNEAKLIFPEFHRNKDTIVAEWQRPMSAVDQGHSFGKYVHKRVSVDLGGIIDKYGLLFGYCDFIAAKIVIEDEALLDKPNTDELARVIREKEAALWPDAEPNRTTRTVDDHTERTIRDLYDLHKIASTKARNSDPDAAIGLVRVYLATGKLVIHPRCVLLRKQLLAAVSNKQGTNYERTEDGHFDLCASLQYFVRDLPLTNCPYPATFNVLTGRELPPEHPVMARRELAGERSGGLREAFLANNRWVAGARRR